jgi:hypothetical protein
MKNDPVRKAFFHKFTWKVLIISGLSMILMENYDDGISYFSSKIYLENWQGQMDDGNFPIHTWLD